MKKILSIIMLFGLIITYINLLVSADVDEPLTHVNLLDLSKLDYQHGSYYAKYRSTLELAPNTTYTIVLSRDFLGSLWSVASSLEFEVESPDGSYYHAGPPDIDLDHERVSFSFFSALGLIEILKIPVDHQSNYEIVLFEGEYHDFPGFSPFLSASEVLEYHGVLPVDYDQRPTLDMIKHYVVAKSPYGNTISSFVAFDNYTLSEQLPGTYRIVFETSFNHIVKRYYLQLRIFDMTAPSLSIEDKLYISLTDKWTLSHILSHVTVIDNVDTIYTHQLSVISDTYTHATTVGTYELVVKAEDNSGNSSTLSIPIELIDTVGPVIEGPQTIYMYTTDTPLTNQQIQNRFRFYDYVDGINVNIMMTHNEYQQKQIPGKYRITFRAIDLSDNVTYFDAYIHIIDNKGPIFETSELILVQSPSSPLSDEDIIDWLSQQLSSMGHQATHIKMLYNEYENHQKTPGSYYAYLSYRIQDETMTTRVRIDVTEKNTVNWVLVSSIGGVVITISLSSWFIFKRKKHIS